MTNSKRSRDLAERKAARQAQRRAERRRRKQIVLGSSIVVAIVAAGIALVLVNRPASETEFAASDTPTPVEITEPDDAVIPLESAPDADPNVTAITFATNRGTFVVSTQSAEAPQTVGSMAFLSDDGFFDGITCHRLTTAGIFVLQCGDPNGDGTGGPGYTVPDENLPAEGAANYPAGTVAMANAGPGTSGSQFFIVYEDTTLPPAYTIWGTVTEGLDVVRQIAAEGTRDGSPDGPPITPIVIESASTTRIDSATP